MLGTAIKKGSLGGGWRMTQVSFNSMCVLSTCLISRTALLWEYSETRFGCIQEEVHSKGRQDSKQELGMGRRLNHNWEAPMEIFLHQQIKKSAFLRYQNIKLGSSTHIASSLQRQFSQHQDEFPIAIITLLLLLSSTARL